MVEVHLLTAMILGNGDQIRYDVMFRVIGLDAEQFTSSVVNWDQFIQIHNQMNSLFSAGPKREGRMSLQGIVSEVVMRFGATKVSFHDDWSWNRYAENMHTIVREERRMMAQHIGHLMLIGSLLDDCECVLMRFGWRRTEHFSLYLVVGLGGYLIGDGKDTTRVVRWMRSVEISQRAWMGAVASLIEYVYEDTSEWWVDSTVG